MEIGVLKLGCWNVNSLKVRLDQVLTWLESAKVDVIALQETKLIDENFPVEVFIEKGFHVAYSGQKTYNGVAIISRYPISEIQKDIPDLNDPERRIIAATIEGIRLINLYVPNGMALSSDKYVYKLMWLEKVISFTKAQLNSYEKVAVVGDFNIAPEDIDVHEPSLWQDGILVSDKERKAFFEFLSLGLKDSFRTLSKDIQKFSWWDYRAASFRRGRGLRIDHILLNDALINKCVEADIDIDPRRDERPSDHAPVWVMLNN